LTDGKAGAAVNPFTDHFIITPENLAGMKQQKEIAENGVYRHVIKKDTVVQIGEPKVYPHEMVDAVKTCARNSKATKAIWLKLMIKTMSRVIF